MASTTAQSICLGKDNAFRERIRALFQLEAGVVYNEDGGTPNHAARALFASKIITGQVDASSLAPALAQMTNLVAEDVSYDFDGQKVATTATDAEIRSQIATAWNLFAGV